MDIAFHFFSFDRYSFSIVHLFLFYLTCTCFFILWWCRQAAIQMLFSSLSDHASEIHQLSLWRPIFQSKLIPAMAAIRDTEAATNIDRPAGTYPDPDNSTQTDPRVPSTETAFLALIRLFGTHYTMTGSFYHEIMVRLIRHVKTILLQYLYTDIYLSISIYHIYHRYEFIVRRNDRLDRLYHDLKKIRANSFPSYISIDLFIDSSDFIQSICCASGKTVLLSWRIFGQQKR
jgi:hypothetical protein